MLQKFRPYLEFTTEGTQELGGRRLYRLVGKPKASQTGGPSPIGSLQVWIGADDGFLHRIVVSDLVARRAIWFGGTGRTEADMDLFYAFLGGAGVDAIGNRIAGKLGYGSFPLRRRK